MKSNYQQTISSSSKCSKTMSKISGLLKGPLKNRLVELIRLRGALSVADYMKIVLTNPESGFYMNKDVFGVKGHFTTSPEISQVFGEILGAWIVHEWRRFGSPRPLNLVEFGPGRGTLMSDIARTIQTLEKSIDDLQISMIEVSPQLKEVQNEALKTTCSSLANSTKWYNHMEELDENKHGFSAYIAHEFLDALPVHKFVRDPKSRGWRELLIDYDKSENLRFCIARQPSLSSTLLIPKNFPGDHIEVCPEAALTLEKVTKRLNASGKGCMLICDYGFDCDKSPTSLDHKQDLNSPTSLKPVVSERDTFRAFKNHESWPPLKDPGEADLTADVDFAYLKQHIEKVATVFGPVTQQRFLVGCGLETRLEALRRKAKNQSEEDELISGVRMLLDDMGERYKFMSIFPSSSKHLFRDDPPAGFGVGHNKAMT